MPRGTRTYGDDPGSGRRHCRLAAAPRCRWSVAAEFRARGRKAPARLGEAQHLQEAHTHLAGDRWLVGPDRGESHDDLAGADLTRDLGGELGTRGFTVVTHTAYRMIPVAGFSDAVSDAFRAGKIDAVMHYSRRSARDYVEAARTDGVEISALALPQCCISEAVAGVLREAGATQVTAARAPDEKALLAVVDRMVKASSA